MHTANVTNDKMSVTIVAESTVTPNRDFISPSSRNTGNTIPTSCDAKSDA